MNIKQPIVAERTLYENGFSIPNIILYPQENTVYFYFFVWFCILLFYNVVLFRKKSSNDSLYPWLFVPVVMGIWFVTFVSHQMRFPDSGGWAIIGLIPTFIIVLLSFLLVASILGWGRRFINDIINKEIP